MLHTEALCDKAKFLGFSKFNLSNRKHAKVREVASLKIAFGRGKFIGRKVWKGQVYGKFEPIGF